MKNNSELSPIQFWERVKFLLKLNKISYITISKAIGVSVNTIYAYIQRGALPTLEIAYNIATQLNVSCEYLLIGSDSFADYKLELLEKENTELQERLKNIHHIALTMESK